MRKYRKAGRAVLKQRETVQGQYRLRKNSQFQYVYRRGRNAGAKELSVIYLHSAKTRVGFSVSKKIGKAVVRNLVKRRLRAAFTQELPQIKPGLYIIVARAPAADATYKSLRKTLQYCLRKHGLYQENV